MATYEVTAPLSSRRYLHSYRLYLNRPRGYPNLAPDFTWIFYRNRDGLTKTFIEQGFTIVHPGPEIVDFATRSQPLSPANQEIIWGFARTFRADSLSNGVPREGRVHRRSLPGLNPGLVARD